MKSFESERLARQTALAQMHPRKNALHWLRDLEQALRNAKTQLNNAQVHFWELQDAARQWEENMPAHEQLVADAERALAEHKTQNERLLKRVNFYEIK